MKHFGKYLWMLAATVLVCLTGAFAAACGKSVVLSFEFDGSTTTYQAKAGEEFTLPEPEGGNFDGWYLSSDFSGEKLSGTITAPDSDTTYYGRTDALYTVTLDAAGGSLSTRTLKLKAGENLYQAVKDLVPEYEGLEFGAWFWEGRELPTSAVMPQSDVTLAAKYKVGYTTEVYLQKTDLDGYELNQEYSFGGSDYLGERVVLSAPRIEGFSRNSAHQNDTSEITLSSMASINILRCYFDRLHYPVRYEANVPSGADEAYGETEGTELVYGVPQNAAECGFEIDGYRFLGWAAGRREEIKYRPGDPLEYTAQTLYAVWQKGLVDAFGGSDLLFPSDTDDTVIYLFRGSREIAGEYDPDTQEFVFRDGGRVMLRGKVTGENFFYYNESLVGKSYRQENGNETVKFLADGKVEYTDAAGTHRGSYEYSAERGYYVFTDEQGDMVVRFVLNGEEFRRQNDEEVGYYSTAEGYPVLFLDGLGGYHYWFDPEDPTYRDYTDVPILEATGEYEYDAEKECFDAQSYVGDYPLERFCFRLTEGQPGAVAGFDLRGAFLRSDYLSENFYVDVQRPEEEVPYIDGFGKGSYHGESGTYSTVRDFYLALNQNEAVRAHFILLTTDLHDFYFLFVEDRYGTIDSDLLGGCEKGASPAGLYEFDGKFIVRGNDYEGMLFFMRGEEGEGSVAMVKYDERMDSKGETNVIYAAFFIGRITEEGPNTEGQEVYYFSTQSDGEFYFTIENGKAKYSPGSPRPPFYVSQSDPTIYVDPGTGTALYNGTEIDYSASYGVADYYEFYVSDTLTLYYIRPIGEETFLRLEGKDILDIHYVSDDESTYNPYPARLLLVDSRNAYIASPMTNDEFLVIGWGTYEPLKDKEGEPLDDEFTFVSTEDSWVENLLDYFGGEGFESSMRVFLDDYGEFVFRRLLPDTETGTGGFLQRGTPFEYENFVATGYGNVATYYRETAGTTETIVGTYQMLETVIVFTVQGGDTVYRLLGDESTGRVKEVGDEAGLYYLYDANDVWFATFGPNNSSGNTDYIVLDGDGSILIVSYEEDYIVNRQYGSYEPTENFLPGDPDDPNAFLEYLVTVTTTNGRISYNILLSTYTTMLDETFLCYDFKDAAMISRGGSFYTDDGGYIESNGYKLSAAVYHDGEGVAHYGQMYIVTFKDSGYNYDDSGYDVDANGNCVVFTVYDNLGEPVEQFVFDIEIQNGQEILRERKLRFGTFALWEFGMRTGAYMKLDGHSGAIVYNAEGEEIGRGAYELSLIDEITYAYHKVSGSVDDFFFAIVLESSSDGGRYFEYRIYDNRVCGDYASSDWARLRLGNYSDAEYVDRYGMVYQGYYEIDDEDPTLIRLITQDGSELSLTFRLDPEGETFEIVE